MSFSFLPTRITESVADIDPEQLRKMNIRLLMLDFDNTIVPYTTSQPTETVDSWIKKMLASDIQICVVSNSRKDRVRRFCEAYGMDCITHARKPFTDGICRCLQKYGVKPQEAALVGDQIYTDTLGANCAGIKAILVRAIHNHNFWLKARHVLEIPFIYIARNRRLGK